ncbi:MULTISPECIES: ABC transporter ATP-binding protein [Corynebacterium]|uniref:ABC transporter ATP-binding protein n=1 Tax=Corynebacterium TaxID=1716 RepID=UPI0008D99D6A|nr:MULTISPECIES: sn-glycerol-3-phosphate ABC transporter ATP-binding protein UgpC [Corynebacterium]MDK8244113.1 sn-glycerol-3-phosphate ABC transporter ATP-binding protein UgpC [Corynebacterium sp. UMB10321]UUA87251.1 sn-glycerol-3-phosphate ABC transporter ATP-binding protein UgpC [Corynebacterium pseudogenitalium]
MASVTYDNATRIYPGATTPSVDKLNLEIADGEFLVLVGPSGSGKSTALRMLAGLEDTNEGHIRIGDRDVTHVSPKDRDIAMVFQNYALYPHMTVRENMGFALKIAGMDKAEIDKRVEEAAKTLDLTQYLDRKPKALSGGQRQRVAMGRAIVRKPQVFLMDEPLSNLDAKLRVQTRTQIANLQRRMGVTTLYVTHDQTEALTMGDRIAVLNFGVLQQVGTPRELYDHPNNVFVAGFIGSPAMNLSTFDVDLTEKVAKLGRASIPLSDEHISHLTVEDDGQVILGFRPESLQVVDETAKHSIPVEIDFVEELGSDSYLYGHLAGGGWKEEGLEEETSGQIVVRTAPLSGVMKGDVVHVQIVDGGLHVFSKATGQRI